MHGFRSGWRSGSPQRESALLVRYKASALKAVLFVNDDNFYIVMVEHQNINSSMNVINFITFFKFLTSTVNGRQFIERTVYWRLRPQLNKIKLNVFFFWLQNVSHAALTFLLKATICVWAHERKWIWGSSWGMLQVQELHRDDGHWIEMQMKHPAVQKAASKIESPQKAPKSKLWF